MKRTILALAAGSALSGCDAELPLEPETRVHSVALESRPGDVAVMQDGRILVALDGRILRFLPDGSIDTTFGRDGFRELVLVDTRLAIGPDRIYVSGRYPAFFYSDYGFEYRVVAFDLDGADVVDWGVDGTKYFYDYEIRVMQPTPAGLVVAGGLDRQVAWTSLDRAGAVVSELIFDAPEDVRVLAASGRRLFVSSTTRQNPPWAALGYEVRRNGTFRPIASGRTDIQVSKMVESNNLIFGCGQLEGAAVLFRIQEGALEHDIEEVTRLSGDGRCIDFVVDGKVRHVLFADSLLNEARVRSFDSMGHELPSQAADFSAPGAPYDSAGAIAARADGTLWFAFGERDEARLVMFAPGS